MRIKTSIEHISCDSCGNTLTIPTVLRNDGSFQETFLTFFNKELCIPCSAHLASKLKIL